MVNFIFKHIHSVRIGLLLLGVFIGTHVNVSFDNVTRLIELFLTSLVALFAWRALDTLTHRKHSAIEQLRFYADIIVKFDNLIHKTYKEHNYVAFPVEMNDFTLIEIRNLTREKQSILARSRRYYLKHNGSWQEAVHLFNEIEVFCAAMMEGVSAPEVVKDIVASSHCAMVEQHAYLLCINRNESELYKNTIKMYLKLKPDIRARNNDSSRRTKIEILNLLDTIDTNDP